MKKLHPNKIRNMVMVIIVFGTGVAIINLNDTLAPTRAELARFYKTAMDNCVVKSVSTKPYPGKGEYLVLHTTCSDEPFPALLPRGTAAADYSVFKANVKLVKPENSLHLRIIDNGTVNRVEIRSYQEEDDRSFGTRVMLIVIVLGLGLIWIAPDSWFGKRSEEPAATANEPAGEVTQP